MLSMMVLAFWLSSATGLRFDSSVGLVVVDAFGGVANCVGT
jgi:hypothetical protein